MGVVGRHHQPPACRVVCRHRVPVRAQHGHARTYVAAVLPQRVELLCQDYLALVVVSHCGAPVSAAGIDHARVLTAVISRRAYVAVYHLPQYPRGGLQLVQVARYLRRQRQRRAHLARVLADCAGRVHLAHPQIHARAAGQRPQPGPPAAAIGMRVDAPQRRPRLTRQPEPGQRLCYHGRLVGAADQRVAQPARVQLPAQCEYYPAFAFAQVEMAALLLGALRVPEVGVGLVQRLHALHANAPFALIVRAYLG